MRVAVLDDYQGVVLALPCWKRLDGRARVDLFRDTLGDEGALAARLAPYPVIVPIRERTRFSASLLARLPALRHLAMTGRNTGHVDVDEATRRGVLVTATEGSAASAPEHTIGLLLAIVRRIPQEDRALREGRWQESVGSELGGKTLGILGLGRIGTRMAAFGRLLGMRVLAWGPTLTAERAAAAGVVQLALDDLFRESDVVSVHLRLSEQSRGLVGGRLLGLMKQTAYLVNTARGPIVDEPALIGALRERRIAGAALDVFDVEPLPRDHPLLSLDNVVLTPHLGYVTREAYHTFFEQAVENILTWLEGRVPARALNPEALGPRQPAT
ncbi:MAG: hydroxyacid dehydrogenase [Candidatus Rokuibacteriota bacterium]|nr:MAG: hydroxyacid dehydrogenase [Candidatus Rokubacteria bacterium]